MARFTIEDLQRLAGEGRSTDTSRYPDGTDTSQHLLWVVPTISARIWDAVNRSGGALTRRQIADALGLKKTPWLCQCIERLVAEGYLVRTEGRSPQGFAMYWYEVKR